MPKTSEILAEIKERPRKGERAALIRKLSLRYPELGRSDIAKRAGCTPQNVTYVLKSFLSDHTEAELKDFQANTANIYDALKFRVLESVTQDKLDKMPAYPAIVSAGILHDKAALLRGQATSMNVNVLMDVAEMLRQKREGSEG